MGKRATLVATTLRALTVAALVSVSGCAQQQVRDAAQELLRGGQFEAAIEALEHGLAQHPGSAVLRVALLQARQEALVRMLAEAAAARAAGRLDDAEALLRRAQPYDGGGRRVEAQLADIAVERRQRIALTEAEEALSTKHPQLALRRIADALKDNPRQPQLLALQRRLQSEMRREQARAAQVGLAEVRPISLDFRDAALRSVLDVVTRHSGIDFVLDKDIRGDTRVTVLLRGARVEDAIDLIVGTHQLSKKVVDARTVLIYPNTPEKQREHQEQIVRVFHLASADAKGAAAFLRAMLRIKEPHVDERMNLLAIREPAEVVELAERLITIYDVSDAEVLLELEVLEVRSSRLSELGIQFPDTIGITALPPRGGAGLTVDNLRGLGSDRLGVAVGGLLLSLKRTVGDFNTLANPRIRARNRERARVLIGDKVPVVTSTTGQGGFVAESVSYLDVGLKLEVEPTVFADDDVAIRVNLEVSSLGREVRTSTGGLAYQIGTRSASTLLRLRDGETQLLAGLVSNDERVSANRLPGLGDLPLAGRLFSNQRDESQRTELVLAITPRVLRSPRHLEASESEIRVGTDVAPALRIAGRPVSGPPPLAADRPAVRRPDAAGAATGAAPSAPDSVPDGPRRTVALNWIAPRQVKVGDTLVAALDVNSNAALRGLPVELRWTVGKLQLLDVEEGELFRGAGATSFAANIDASAGVARVGLLRAQASGVTGQGTLVRLRLKALEAGVAELSLGRVDAVSLADDPQVLHAPPLRLEIKP